MTFNLKNNNYKIFFFLKGDTNMAEGFPLISNELKIGFLNDHVDKFLPIYLNKFDIVIIEDHTFDIPNSILAAIFQS